MRIGIMLRHLDQHGGGVMVYTRNLLTRLLKYGSDHEFVLIYKNPAHLGRYDDFENAREIAISAPSKFIWDQLVVPYVERREDLDVIFNPKYSLPLAARCPTVFVSHGLDWYVNPQWSRWIDRINHQVLIPRYVRKATRIISVSEVTREHLKEYLQVPPEKVDVVYLGIAEHFRQPVSPDEREVIKQKYSLPDRFLLYCGQIYPPKNFGRLVKAYREVGPERDTQLVVAGQHTWLCEDEVSLVESLGLEEWVRWLGWVPNEELPGVYHQAKALTLPSLYESFGIPLLEAMACSCPVLTADCHGTKEIAGDAAVLVDPESVASIADGMRSILDDPQLREDLIRKGNRRHQSFNWEGCARETLAAIEACSDNALERPAGTLAPR